nr:MAG TPA_asm: hypothetical protein [Caudoviricetes sp.]
MASNKNVSQEAIAGKVVASPEYCDYLTTSIALSSLRQA